MEKEWQIWSNEHRAWWMPYRHGYTKSRGLAGLYSFEEASEICANANQFLADDQPPNETMLPYVKP